MWQLAFAFSAGAAVLLGLPGLGDPGVFISAAVAAVISMRRRPVIAAAIAGFAWTQLLASDRVGSVWPCTRDRDAVTVTGRVAVPALEREGRTDFDLDVLDAESVSGSPR